MYFTLEPFGEERADLRVANHMRWHYDLVRGGKGNKLTLGELTLYPDMQKESSERSSREELEATLGRFAERSDG